MRALVIGADGFVGRHLVAHLRDAGDEVVAAGGPSAAAPDQHHLDVRDPAAARSLLAETQPEAVYHLAAVAYGWDAAQDVRGAYSITVVGTVNILEAAAALPRPPHVLIPGSAEVYGSPTEVPVAEWAPMRPVNLYGATKVAQEALGLAFATSRGLGVTCTRSFNHIGPGQRDAFAVASFARQLAEIHAGTRDPRIMVGNLQPIRDFSDVRDVVRAYRMLVAADIGGEPINVASGHGIAVGDLLAMLIRTSGLDVAVEVDPARVRATDPPAIVGNATRLRQLTGWVPTIGLEQTLVDVWEDALARFGSGRPIS